MQKPLKTRVNSKYQSKGSTYILHLLAFVEIFRLFNVFFWQRKVGFGKLMKNVRDADSREKGAEMRDRDPPFQTLPHGCFMQIGLDTFAIQVVEVVEFDNHSLLGEVVGGEIRAPCLRGGVNQSLCFM